MPDPFEATRYHSLIVKRETLPDCLEITAWTEEGEIMGLMHKHHPVHGVQFHPESILTRHGFRLLANFLTAAGIPHRGGLVDFLDEEIARQAAPPLPHDAPASGHVVTF